MDQLRRLFEIIRKDGVVPFYYKLRWKIRSKKFYKLINRKEWEKAIGIGENLTSIFPDNDIYPSKLALCYLKLDRNKKANEIMQEYLKLNYDINEIIDFLEAKFDSTGLLDSKYLRLEGKANDGVIEHTFKSNSKAYITKMSTEAACNKKERLFYLNICSYYPYIKKITPNLINYTEIEKDNLMLLTMEKIEGKEYKLTANAIYQVAKISQEISSIRYGEIQNWFPVQIHEVRDQLHALLGSFDSIHKESRNKEIFHFIHEKLIRLNYSRNTIKLMKRMENIIINKRIYTGINPLIHYSIQHGDFFKKHLLWEKTSHKIYVIDWGLMRIGPTWCDMAGFLGREKIPFQEIKHNYLNNNNASGHLDLIEKLFFIYTLIVVWFQQYSKKEFEKSHETHVLPAVELLEDMAMHINDQNSSISV